MTKNIGDCKCLNQLDKYAISEALSNDINNKTNMKTTNLAERNEEIDTIFKRIIAVSEDYLERTYPDAPDPDVYIEIIEGLIDKYREIELNFLLEVKKH